jgi:hypothetical protein
LPEDCGRRDAEACQGHRRDEDGDGTSVQGMLPAVFQSMAAFSASPLEAACRAPQQNNDMQ